MVPTSGGPVHAPGCHSRQHKYSYLVATLPEDVATRALDYIESMADSDSTEKYKGLKDELLGTFTQTAYCDFV